MLFYSTHKKAPKVSFETALIQGLAPDGGLYVPEEIPVFNSQELSNLTHASLRDVGYMVMNKWVEESIPPKKLYELMGRALDFPVKLRQVGDYYVLELFHGPTMAFKDFAVKCLAQFMEFYLERDKKNVTLLVATSGDTGGAVAQGFANIKHTKVVILYPHERVTKLQEEQMTRVAPNVTSVAVEGSFDDCQDLVKEAFLDPELKSLNLTSANSINIGRLLPQIIYYVYTYALLHSRQIQFFVPSGNMGNATAGLMAAKMGLPFTSFVNAFNSNDPVVDYYKTGEYHPQETIPTLSNAMDIGNPSNFERVLELFNQSHDEFVSLTKAISIDDKQTVETIKKVYKKYGYLLDPHTAVAWASADQLAHPPMLSVILATASPVKFAEEIRTATGIEIQDHHEIAKLTGLEKRVTVLGKEYNTLKKTLLKG